MFSLVCFTLAVVLAAAMAAYLYTTKQHVDIYITTIDNNMDKVIRGHREIVRSIMYNLAPAFFAWLSWATVLGVMRYLAEQSGAFMLDFLVFLGGVLICTHFTTMISRLQIDVEGRRTAHRLLRAIHGMFLGSIIAATINVTGYLSEQIYLLQPK